MTHKPDPVDGAKAEVVTVAAEPVAEVAAIPETPVPEEVVASNDPAPPAEPATPGEYLHAQRTKIGMSIPDLAMRLRMGAKQIEALERGDYAVLPAGTFLRGFVRNFAKAVHADAAHAITLLEKTHTHESAAKSPTIVVPSQNIKVVPPGGELATPNARLAIVGIVVILLACAVWYWWEYVRPHLASGGRPQPVPETVVNVAQPAAAPAENTQSIVPTVATEVEGAKATEQAAVIAPEIKPAVSAPVTAAKTAPPAAVPAVAAPAAPAKKDVPIKDAAAISSAAGANSLGFTFSGESWVEVIDANGKTLVSRRYKAGETEEATGRAPFSIVIGNAQVTRMAYNGREFDLAPHTRVSVARVTVK
jgi:cytoskeleton protein RodZ